jgi:uncharacterized C2H2 Zn-finger protein
MIAKYNAAFCPKCKIVFHETHSSPWHWSKSAALHTRGTGHKLKRFNTAAVDMLKLAYDGTLVEL